MSVRVIVGLGNPGARYDGTRHNVGFRVVDALAREQGVGWREEKRYRAHTASVILNDQPVLLAKPQTFMNASGRAVGEICRFLKLRPAEVCVVYDEYQVPVGGLKVSLSGSAGGHNGIADLIARIGPNFVRYRIGVGPEEKPPDVSMADFVLGPFTTEESARVEASLSRYLEGLRQIVAQGPQLAMNSLNQRPKPSIRTHSPADHEPDGNERLPRDGDI